MDKNSLIDSLLSRYPSLKTVRNALDEAAEAIIECYSNGGKLLICGNGGSSSDADHMAAELMKSFERERPLPEKLKKSLAQVGGSRGKYLADRLQEGLPAISLSAHTALLTAISNDIDACLAFAQQVNVYGSSRDILIGISTSGNSQNIVDACITARSLKMKVIGITGRSGGKMSRYCDILINVPEKLTARVQELHLPVLHTLCRITELNYWKS